MSKKKTWLLYDHVFYLLKSVRKLEHLTILMKNLNFELKEFLLLYSQIFENTGLRTLHGVKGEEFEKVI
ncbi:hypothetical protein, partial [Peribacillus sp. NPDC060253]